MYFLWISMFLFFEIKEVNMNRIKSFKKNKQHNIKTPLRKLFICLVGFKALVYKPLK